MKKLWILALALVCGALQVCAAGVEILTELPKALERAKAENKLILMDFSGSDWCKPCRDLDKHLWSSAGFAEFAKSNVVFLQLDYPEKTSQPPEVKKTNEKLMDEFNKDGMFPTILFLTADRKVLLKEEAFIGDLKALNKLFEKAKNEPAVEDKKSK